MAKAQDRQSSFVHSKDFDRFGDILGDPDRINGKTLREWNDEHELTGILAALSDMGWDTWQWRWRSEVATSDPEQVFSERGCFMEVFGHNYGGYIRTDAKTLKECGEKALARAQRFAACEVKTGHDFGVPDGYTNGYFQCKTCGFGGYTPMFKRLNQAISNIQIHADLLKEENVKLQQAIRDAGYRVRGWLGEPAFHLEKEENQDERE